MASIRSRIVNFMLWPLFKVAWLLNWAVLPAAKAIGVVTAYFAYVLHPTRAVLLLLLLYVLALTMTDQGRELVLSLPLDPADGWGAILIAWVIFAVAAFWASLQAWWWARVLLDNAISAAIRAATNENGRDKVKTRMQIDSKRVAATKALAVAKVIEDATKLAEAEKLADSKEVADGKGPADAKKLADAKLAELKEQRRELRKQLEEDPRVVLTPRIYAFALYAAAAVASGYPYNAEGHWIAAAVMLGLGVLMLLFLTLRRNKRVNKWLPVWLAAILNPGLKINDDAYADKEMSQRAAGRRVPGAFRHFSASGMVMLVLSFGAAIVMFIAQRYWAAGIGALFGALPLALMGLSSIIPILAALTLGEAMSRAPVILVLVLFAFGWSLFPSLDHHRVRAIEDAPPIAERPFKDIETAYRKWVAVNDPDGSRGTPMILVYTAGGGIRAAYWTSALLTAMDAADSRFHKQVFAISGVSGGSVGAVFWTAALRNQADPAPCKMGGEGTSTNVTPALGVDHLATTIGALLYSDAFHAFVPIGTLDRATALEQSWERAFMQTTGGDCLNKGFNVLWSDLPADEWRPLLLINGTHQETGRRIITAPLPIADSDFPDTMDFFGLFGREIRASTAALNSARFTYVSPAGRITSKDGADLGHVLDGGYFENYGARTIRDLMVVLDTIQLRMGKRRPVIVVEIVNDTDLTDADAQRKATIVQGTVTADEAVQKKAEELKALQPGWYGYGLTNEIVAPLQGLLATRGARGILEAKLSARNFESLWVASPDGWRKSRPALLLPASGSNDQIFQPVEGFEHVQLRLCPVVPKPPLGWVLGKASAKTMDTLVTTTTAHGCGGVHGEIEAILKAAGLNSGAP